MRLPPALSSRFLRACAAALTLLAIVARSPAAAPAPASARAAAFDAAKLAAIDEAVARAIADRKIPGGVLWIERAGEVHRRVYGNRSLEPAPEAATEDTIYDAASLTKVIATTTAVMRLVERGQLEVVLPRLIADHQLLRLKGRAWLAGKPHPLQIQAVGPRLECWFDPVTRSGSDPEQGLQLVALGLQVSAPALQQQLEDALRAPSGGMAV